MLLFGHSTLLDVTQLTMPQLQTMPPETRS